MPRLSVLATGLSLLAACDHPAKDLAMPEPHPTTVRLSESDPTFKRTPQERASIREGFDVDALERLLASIVPAARPILLVPFQRPPPGQHIGAIVHMTDPSLQPLLDEVWAPMWELMPPGAIDSESTPFPGRELARERRSRAAESEKKQR